MGRPNLAFYREALLRIAEFRLASKKFASSRMAEFRSQCIMVDCYSWAPFRYTPASYCPEKEKFIALYIVAILDDKIAIYSDFDLEVLIISIKIKQNNIRKLRDFKRIFTKEKIF